MTHKENSKQSRLTGSGKAYVSLHIPGTFGDTAAFGRGGYSKNLEGEKTTAGGDLEGTRGPGNSAGASKGATSGVGLSAHLPGDSARTIESTEGTIGARSPGKAAGRSYQPSGSMC